MTAIVTTTRFWESEDSAESINNRFLGQKATHTINSSSVKELKNNNSNPGYKTLKKSDKKSSRTLSRTSILAVPKRRTNEDAVSESKLNRVKRSALLYEITERTNRLARPKTVITDSGTLDKEKSTSRNSVPKIVNERICELSRPKLFYNPPTRPPGYVAPSALRAVATQRIVELATPQKTRSVRSPVRKNALAVISAPCSSRISYLARPKHFANSSKAQRNFLKRNWPADNLCSPPWYY